MPEYFPQINLPQGLAEQAVQLRAKRIAPNPWENFDIGQPLSQVSQFLQSQQQNKPFTPEQLAQINAGQIPAGMSKTQALPLLEKMIMAQKGNIPGSPAVDAMYAKAGLQSPGKDSYHPAEIKLVDELSKNMMVDVPQGLRDAYKDTPLADIKQLPQKTLDHLMSLQVTNKEHEGQFDKKRLTALGDALDASKQRAGAFGVSKQVFDRAERLQTLASAFQSGNLDSRQIEEMAIGLNAMLSGSNTGAQQQVKALVPSSIMGNAQKFKEWLVNEPQGTNQQAFVNRMLGSIEREKATADDQMKRTQFQRAMKYQDLEKSNPDEFYNALQSVGRDPEEYKSWKKGGFKSIDAVQKPEGGSKHTQWTDANEKRLQELEAKHSKK